MMNDEKNREISVDYLSYQVEKVGAGRFSVIFRASVKREGVPGFVIEDDLGNVRTFENCNIKDGVASCIVENLDLNTKHIELAVRPFLVTADGRVYGKATILAYLGEKKDGVPVLFDANKLVPVDIISDGDTYTQVGVDTPLGNADCLGVKNWGKGVINDRVAYLHFTFDDTFAGNLPAANRVVLRLFTQSGRRFVEDEAEKGGILAGLYGIDGTFDEKTLTYETSKAIREGGELVSSFRYVATGRGYFSVDVTDFVRKKAAQGKKEVCFRLENAMTWTVGAETRFSSRRSKNPPMLRVEFLRYGHAVDLEKYANDGFEPWSYAEKLTDEWFGGDYEKLFGTTYDATEVTPTYSSSGEGEFSQKLDWIHTTGTELSNHYYIRTLDTLTENCGYKETSATFDRFGGVDNAGFTGKTTGFFHTETIGKRTYLIDPLGNPFFAMGANTVGLGSTEGQKARTRKKFGEDGKFFDFITKRLMETGINTAYGINIDRLTTTKEPMNGVITIGMAHNYMASLGLNTSTGGTQSFANNNTMNMFDPDFVTACYARAERLCPQYKGNQYLIGYVGDNELPYQTTMLYDYLTLDPRNPVCAFSYATAWTWFIRATGKNNPSVADITPALSEQFKGFLFNRYFKTVCAAVRSVDKEHLMMGDRCCADNCTSEGHLRAAGYYNDVLTVNYYRGPAPEMKTAMLIRKYAGKPFIVTEFFAIGKDTVDGNGYPMSNMVGAGWKVETQKDRANSYESYALLMLESGYCVGLTWYRFQDNDQSVWRGEDGTIYLPYAQTGRAPYRFITLGTREVVLASDVKVEKIYTGEDDSTNFCSNKGLFDGNMEEYKTITGAFARMSRNVFGLMRFFDEK